MTNKLEYDHIHKPAPVASLYWVALACGLLAMTAGTIAFLGYLITHDHLFAGIGLLTLCAGLAATFIGVVCIAIYFYQAKRANEADAHIAMRNFGRAAGVLAVNFPLAAIYAGVGIYLVNRDMERALVTITNEDTTSTLVQLDTGGDTATIGPIAPGASGSATLRFGNAGLRATLTPSGSPPTTQTVLDHLDEDTHGLGVPVTLRLKSGKLEHR